MRIRTIKPEFFRNDKVAELHPLTRLLFQGLWCIADRRGRLEDRPKRIKVEVLPYDDHDVDAALQELHASGMLVRYDANGTPAIQIVNFEKHQRITGKEAESESCLLGPDEKPTGKQSGNNGETPETTGKEGKGKDTDRQHATEPPTDNFQPDEQWLALLQHNFPDRDVMGELTTFRATCKKKGTSANRRGFEGWIRQASPSIKHNGNTPEPERDYSRTKQGPPRLVTV